MKTGIKIFFIFEFPFKLHIIKIIVRKIEIFPHD
jgi:hypothetical protein